MINVFGLISDVVMHLSCPYPADHHKVSTESACL
jgi:hypothetical protein